MKTLRNPSLLSLLLALSLPLAVTAQEVTSSNVPSGNQPPPPPPPPPLSRGPHGPMANLSEQERSQLKAAHDKATQQNPALEQAMKDARQAMEKARKDLHDAMIAIDPSIAPILAKIEPPKWGGHHKGPGGGPGNGEQSSAGGQHHAPPGMANLTEQERGQLKAAHDRIKNDPTVVSAREAMKSATTPEARREAHEALRQAADAALLKVDPSLGPILEKLHQDAPPPPPSTASPQEQPMVPAAQ
jgi:hypothetical protein